MRTALIGIRGYGQFYLQELLQRHRDEQIDLVAASVTHPELSQEDIETLIQKGCAIFPSADEMFAALKGQLDWCCIPTGLDSHYELSMKALQAGCHVLVEKPAANQVVHIHDMQRLSNKMGKQVMVGFQNVYAPDILSIKRALVDEQYGCLQGIKMMGCWPRSADYFKRNHWAGKLKFQDRWVLDSPANNAFGHYLNLMCFLAGRYFEQSANIETVEAEQYRAMPIESSDTVAMRLTTTDQKPLLFLATHACAQKIDPGLFMQCEHATIYWTNSYHEIQMNDTAERFEHPPMNEIRSLMFDRVIQKLQGEKVLVCNLDIAQWPTFCVQKMHESAPIKTIKPAHFKVLETDFGQQTVIVGVEEVFKACMENNTLPSEMEVPWV